MRTTIALSRRSSCGVPEQTDINRHERTLAYIAVFMPIKSQQFPGPALLLFILLLNYLSFTSTVPIIPRMKLLSILAAVFAVAVSVQALPIDEKKKKKPKFDYLGSSGEIDEPKFDPPGWYGDQPGESSTTL